MVDMKSAPGWHESDTALSILKARIALLSTAIGGPDYTSQLDPPPYKLGDDCLACLKDLKRWFKLVDDQQNRWDVAMATAEYRVLVDDLLPILIEWENKSSLANKLSKKNMQDPKNQGLSRNKDYYDNIALNSLQLMVLLTWPLVLTDHSTQEQISVYSDLKKHQLTYKKNILSLEKGKVLKAATRLALNVIKINKLDRTPRDNMILRLVLNFFRNILSIEPGELNIAKNRSSSNRGINITDTLPSNVTADDISLNAVITAFHNNKVFGLLLLLSGSSTEFDNDFIDIPLMEILFQMTKEISKDSLFQNVEAGVESKKASEEKLTSACSQLTQLLEKEKALKKNVIQNTSTRHSRFGALLSIQTADNTRLTVSGGNTLLSDNSALKKLDSRKKWNKREIKKRDDVVIEGLPNSLLNSQTKSIYLNSFSIKILKKFLENFIDSAFNPLLHRLTNHFTTEQDQMVALEQIEYLLFFSWFVSCQRSRCKTDSAADVSYVSVAMEETAFILVSSLLRKSYEEKNWVVVHAGMIAFNELLLLVSYAKELDFNADIEFILSRLFSDERIKLLSDLPKHAFKHTIQYMRSCVDLTHTALKVFEQYDETKSLTIIKKSKQKQKNISEVAISNLVENEGLDRDEALEILEPEYQEFEINFTKVRRQFISESVVETYITFLQRFSELEDSYIKKAIFFLHRVVTEGHEEPLLFRIDFIMLLRDMLSKDGIPRTSKVRKHVESFANYYLYRLKKKLKTSTSWFIGILFPLLHSGDVGFFQKYGERKIQDKQQFYGVIPSSFGHIENEQELPDSHLLDLKFGILVSALIDDGKVEMVNILADHMRKALDIFRSFLSLNVQQETELSDPPNQNFSWEEDTDSNPLVFDRDFRALLQLIGYSIPLSIEDNCYLPGSLEIPTLQNSVELVQKYLSTPFQTSNGLPSSSYLIRSPVGNLNETTEDGWIENDQYEYGGPGVVQGSDGDEGDESGYFDELVGSNSKNMNGKEFKKGLAKSKKAKPRKGERKGKTKRRIIKSNLPTFETSDTETHPAKERLFVSSKEYISDSDDDDEAMGPIFFENEMYMRFLLDKYSGQLPDDKYAQFGRFASERMANNGGVRSDFTDLFGGDVPQLESLVQSNQLNNKPDRTLISLSDRVSKEIASVSNALISGSVANSSQPTVNGDAVLENAESYPFKASAPSIVFTETQDKTSNSTPTDLDQRDSAAEEDSEHVFISRKRQRIFVEEDDD